MITLRDYQVDAADGVLREWEDNRSTLLVLPTGMGKTVVFAEIIRRRQPGRALVIAHREELIWQARERIHATTGLECEVEMGELRTSATLFERAPVIIATVQTLNAGKGDGLKRMGKFKPQDFNTLIIDESHHCTADSYRNVINYFSQNPNLKVLGVTATPDRTDEEALGQIFDTVAFDYEILDAIHNGWLVNIQQMLVPVSGLDFSHVQTTAGDLNQGDLAMVMESESNIQGVVHPTLEAIYGLPYLALAQVPVPQWGNYLSSLAEAKPKRTLVFTVSVKQAESLCNIFNRVVPGMAAWVCGETPKEKRRELLKRYNNGEFPVMVNCNCLSEGFDSPAVELVVQAKPTKSRSLYSQQVGRGTRPLPGTVDGIDDADTRKEAIAASAKPVLTVLDFVGNSGRHKLVSTLDILGGKTRDEILEKAKRRLEKLGKAVPVAEVIDQVEAEEREEAEERRRAEEARKAKLVAKVNYTQKFVDPFSAFGLQPVQLRGWDAGKVLSEKQRSILARQGFDPNMPAPQGKQVLNELFHRWNENLCTAKQSALLKRFGYETKDLKMKDASRLLDQLASNGWRKPESKPQPQEDNVPF